ncbi:MAG: DUF1343 domain-containing protein [Thermomicrobiales bacterium]
MRTGLEILAEGGSNVLHGARVGLVTNPNGVDRTFRSAVDILNDNPAVDLRALFGPEHGVRGDAQAGDRVESATDWRTGVPVHSLHGDTRRPTPEMLDGLDAFVIDMQDMASRYTTYLSTQLEVQAAANEAGMPVVILDRPNPLADIRLEGNLLDPVFQSFVGAHTITIRHGMTAGELGLLVAAERGWSAPTVIPAEGWVRSQWYDETSLPWILPSPNMPNLETLTLYNGTCLVEGTNLSEGRGTTMPFQFVGSPTLDADALVDDLRGRMLAGLAFRRVSFTPMFSKHAGSLCHGMQAYVTDRDALDAATFGIHLLHALKRHDPDFAWVQPDHDDAHRPFFIDLLLGSDRPRTLLEAGASPTDVTATWEDEQAAFMKRRAPFLLYV